MVLWVALGDRLRAARKAKNLRQREVVEACAISHTFYSAIERGYRRPQPETLDRIATYLDLDVAEMRKLAGCDRGGMDGTGSG
jgi:transcriptional regulator with XRE-family HTH domain